MSVSKSRLLAILAGQIPDEIINSLLTEYQNIKQQFFLRKFRPAELNGARFGEAVLRMLEFLNTSRYTPFGTQANSEAIIRSVENNSGLKDTIRFFLPRLTRVVLDVRNKRDVAHVGGEVNPNYSDSLFVVHATDWIMTEIVRHFHNCSVDEAHKIVLSINEIKIPVVAEIDGFIRVQNTDLDASNKVLVVLYYKKPNKVSDADLSKWIRYKNTSRFKYEILQSLDNQALIHYYAGYCVLLPKGILYVEKNIPLNLLS